VLTNRQFVRCKYFSGCIVLFFLIARGSVTNLKNVVRCRMLRAIVKWVALGGNERRSVKRKMNERLKAALEMRPVWTWSDLLFKS
jgi:hypothetical protein